MGPSLLQTKQMSGEVPSVEATLRRVRGFDQLTGPTLERVASLSNVGEARQGEVLFREGDTPDFLYVLLEGRVSMTGTAIGSTSAVVDILGPGSSFVLANALTGDPYLTAAEAVTASTLILIAAEPMRAAVTAQPEAAVAMMRAMSAELGAMTHQVVELKARIAAQRLATYLLNMVNEPTAAKADFRLPVNKGLLASWLGCRAENLSRAFVSLRAFGVETHGSRVLLHDIASLSAYAGASLPEGEAAAQADAPKRPPVEKILGDAFRLRSNRPRGS
jgi:CRP/FNR family transcriptional regulator, transcriptional activator FtrB